MAHYRRARVWRFTGWPPPPPRIRPHEDYPDPRGVVWGVAFGVVAFGLILLAGWLL